MRNRGEQDKKQPRNGRGTGMQRLQVPPGTWQDKGFSVKARRGGALLDFVLQRRDHHPFDGAATLGDWLEACFPHGGQRLFVQPGEAR